MYHPERPSPSRHRNHDKWKRIIEPTGDSDSSEWSSDSDVGMMEGSALHYRPRDSSTVGGSSSSGNRDQQSTLSVTLSCGSQKQSRDALLGYCSVDGDTFKFEQSVGVKTSANGQCVPGAWTDLRPLARLKSIGSDTGAGTSSSSFTHLMHHDYAERDVNNDRGNGDISYNVPALDPIAALRKKWMYNRPEGSSAVLDCSTSANNSNCIPGSALMPDEIAIQEPDMDNNVEANVNEVSEEEDRWRIHSSNRNITNFPSTRKRFLETVINPAEQPDGEMGIAVPGCSSSVVLGTSIQTQTQSGRNDCGMHATTTEPGAHPPFSSFSFFTPSDWYVQKKKLKCSKQVRFREQPYIHEYDDGSALPEDYSQSVRTTEVPEVQVLSMAGPSNSSSRIIYPNGPRSLRPSTEDASTSEDVQAILPPVSNVEETEDEGVEVIMVDDAQTETSVDNRSTQATAAPSQEQQEQQPQEQQQQQQQQQQSSIQKQEINEDENNGPRRMGADDEQLNQGLIGLLECPVCLEYMGPPINQCRRGHLVCSVCKPKLPSCPTCRSKFTECRNLAMEKVADKLHYPCKNAHVGCTTTLLLRNKDDHEANCIFRSYRCIMVPPCEWKGQHGEILPHVRQMHAESLLQGTEHVLQMHLGDFREQSSQNWIVSALGELFRVNLGAVRGGRVQVFGCVLLLGPAQRASLFRYTLIVGPAEGDIAQRQMTYSRTTHAYVERCSAYYSTGDSFHLRTESAQLFSTGPSTDRIMLVRLRIEKTES